MFRFLALALALFLALPGPVLAAGAGNGTIEGLVINGTSGGSSVAGVDVILTSYLNDSESGSTLTKCDAEGRFRFTSLDTGQGYSYQVKVNFQQAEYTSDDILTFAPGETSANTEITVYDSTTSSEAVRVVMAHTVVYAEPDSLRVVEYYLFENQSDRTYIGTEVSGQKETLRFSLPEGATGLKPEQGLMECCIRAGADGFTDSMPVLPGGKEVVYSYNIGYGSGNYLFSGKTYYPTASYDILAPANTIEITSDRLQVKEPLSISGALYSRLSGTNLAPGETFSAQLSYARSGGTSMIWVVPLLLAFTGGLFYLWKRGKLRPVKASQLEEERERLLAELAELDDAFESGRVSEEAYQRLRVEKKSQLVRIILGLEEKKRGDIIPQTGAGN